MDIKEFYLQGDHETMANKVASRVWGPASLHETILYGLLDNQFVSTTLWEHRAWHVASGSGMGFPCAGELADIFFAELSEIDVLRRRHELGILFYGRFRDDIFFICEDRYKWVLIAAALRRNCVSSYRLEMADMSYFSVDFLDVTIIQKSNGVLAWKPFKKDGEIKVPLSSRSSHVRSVHAAWPRAEVERLKRRSSAASFFQDAILDMKKRFIEHGLSCSFPIPPFTILRPARPPEPRKREDVWLVLPHHPSHEKAKVGQLLNELWTRWGTNRFFQCPLRFRIAWKVDRPNHFALLRKWQQRF